MREHITHVAFDMHQASITAAWLLPSATSPELRTIPYEPKPCRRLVRQTSAHGPACACYAAGPLGYAPPRQLEAWGLPCEVIAPSLIPRRPGQRIKTDTRDAKKPVGRSRAGDLTAIRTPTPEEAAARYRRQLSRARADGANRVQKLLEVANLQLGSVASDIPGVSGRAMLAALVRGETDPGVPAGLARGRLGRRHAQPVEALTGRITPVQRALLGQRPARVECLDRAIAELDALTAGRMAPHQAEAARLCTVPGIEARAAEARIAGLGVDVTVFPSDRHCASWAGVCPGNHVSAGKRKSGKTRKGSEWLRATLVEAAWAASRTRGYLGAQYHRLARRRGQRKAAVAVAHSLLGIAYQILKGRTVSRELGHDSFDQRDTSRLQRRLIARLEALGLRVTVEPLPQAA